jgi:O-antigen/teichoic acid export membrane protein
MLRFDKTNIFAAIPFFMIGLSGWMNSKVDLYLVDYFLTPADLSQYQILATAYIMLQGVASFIIYPFSKHIYRLKHISLIRIRKLVGLAGIPIVGIGSWLIWFFLSNYTSVSFSTSIYLIMTIASLPFFLFTVDIYLCYKHQKEKTIMWITFIGAFTILIFVSILTPIYGIFGAVIGICISKWLLLLLYKLKRIK